MDDEPKPKPRAAGGGGSPRPAAGGAPGAGQQDAQQDAGAWRAPRGAPPRAPASRYDDPNDGLRRSLFGASSKGEHAKVLEMIGKWRRRSAPVDEPVYRAALVACAHEGAWEQGAELLNVLEEYGVLLQAFHFDAVLRACDRRTRWQEVNALTAELEAEKRRACKRSPQRARPSFAGERPNCRARGREAPCMQALTTARPPPPFTEPRAARSDEALGSAPDRAHI